VRGRLVSGKHVRAPRTMSLSDHGVGPRASASRSVINSPPYSAIIALPGNSASANTPNLGMWGGATVLPLSHGCTPLTLTKNKRGTASHTSIKSTPLRHCRTHQPQHPLHTYPPTFGAHRMANGGRLPLSSSSLKASYIAASAGDSSGGSGKAAAPAAAPCINHTAWMGGQGSCGRGAAGEGSCGVGGAAAALPDEGLGGSG
jgi:hypothetical protein